VGGYARFRISKSFLLAASIVGFAILPAGVHGERIGSPLLHRPFADVDRGQVYIYKGTGDAFQSYGKISAWAFYDDQKAGMSVTPLLFKIVGKDIYALVGVGTTRASAGTGLQSFSFDLIAGSDDVAPGQFTFGFANRAYSVRNGALAAGAPNTGAVAIERPSATVPNDPWVVTAEVSSGGPIALNIGTIIGGQGIPIYNPMDPEGLDRVYSAQASIVPINHQPSTVNLERDRTFGYRLPSGIGLKHPIEASTDLVHWTVLTNTALYFRDFDSSDYPSRFYRFPER